MALDSEGIMDLVNEHLLVVLVTPLLRTLLGESANRLFSSSLWQW